VESEEIKKIVLKVDIGKIGRYYQEHSKSATLRRIVGYFRRIYASSEEEEIFRLATRLAYGLELIVSNGYVKKEKEKKY